MASNTYVQFYSDGTSKRVKRIKKQGRPKAPKELKKVPLNVTVDKSTKERVTLLAEKFGCSTSQYVDLVLSLYEV